MEKCPPAEACRDAFERMSKATVQMCMSTTGFGFGLDSGRQRTTSDTRSGPSVTSMGGEASSGFPGPTPSDYGRSQQRSPVKTRPPPPRFDMNLRDLFPDDINQENLASQSYIRQRPAQFSPSQSQPSASQAERSSVQYSFSQPPESLNNQINAGLGLNANQLSAGNTSQFQQQQQQQQQQTMQPMQGNLPSNPSFYNMSAYGIDLSNVPGLDFLQANEDNQNLDTTGIDLGFGPGMDFQHDWSDGTGVDIFDGFFFGNAAG
jgi:hypothetical protein